jgi:hypothetical protein
MRNVVSLVLLLTLLSALCWGQSSSGEYSVDVHVSSSHWLMVPTSIGPSESEAQRDHQRQKIRTGAKRPTLLALGDYKAKLIEDVHKNSYESTQTYEFQFSDGKTRKFIVVGQTE